MKSFVRSVLMVAAACLLLVPLTAMAAAPAKSAAISKPAVQITFKAGDRVQVINDSARLMNGREVLGTIPMDKDLTVLNVQGPWLEATFSFSGQNKTGWIYDRDVKLLSTPAAEHTAATSPMPGKSK